MSASAELNQVAMKSNRPKPLLSVILAVAASLIAWGFIKAKHPVYLVPEEYHITQMGAPVEKVQALEAQQFRVDRLNTALFMAVLGGPLAVAVALGGSACCAAWLRVLVALPWGALCGAATGFAAAMIVQKIGHSAEMPTVADNVKQQGLLFAGLGAGIGLMMGIFGRSVRSVAAGLFGGLVAGSCAALAFSVFTSLVMPAEDFKVFVPVGLATRLLWLALPCACIGYVIPVIAAPRSTPAAKSTSGTEPPPAA